MSDVRYERPEILTRIPRRGHAVIEASAGTGKTYTLANLVVDLLISGGTAGDTSDGSDGTAGDTSDTSDGSDGSDAREDQALEIQNLLVVTFTEKATTELSSRVRSTIEALLAAGPADDHPELPPERVWVLDERARSRLRRALFAFDSATISTIHGFGKRVLTEHAFENRRLFEQESVDERVVFSSAFRDALRRELACDPLLARWLGPALTRRTVEKLDEFLYKCHTARGQLGPVLNEKSLVAAVLACAAAPAPTEEALADAGVRAVSRAKVLREHEKLRRAAAPCQSEADLPAFLVALEDADTDLDYLLSTVPDEARFSSLRSAMAQLSASLVSLDAALAGLFLSPIRKRLEKKKRELGQYDFEDMLRLVQASLDGPRGEELAASLRARYRVALIDEAQDTDDIQWRIFERIFVEPARENTATPASQGSGARVFLIGDPKQAIYGFRGADVATYLRARDRLQNKGSLLHLPQNFRSTGAMIRAYNAILDPAAPSPFFTGDNRYDEPVGCGRPARCAVDEAGRDAAAVQLVRIDAASGMPSAPSLRRLLGQHMAAEIRRILDGGLRVGERASKGKPEQLRPITPEQIYILTRSAAEGRELGEVLREAGVLHAYYKQEGLFQTEEAAHIRDLLRAIDEPQRRGRCYRAWLTPFFGLGLDELLGARAVPLTHPLYQRLLSWKSLADARDFDCLYTRILDDSGLVRRLVFESESERALTNYLHLFEILLEEARRTGGSLRELSSTLSRYIDGDERPEGESGNVQRLESERGAVQIMTMHKAKGLEAEVVFLCGGFRAPPNRGPVRSFHDAGARISWIGPLGARESALLQKETDEEDERLLYVAMTRARSRLYLPYFPSVQGDDADDVAPKSKSKSNSNSNSRSGERGFTGGYRLVNERLRAIDRSGRAAELGFSVEDLRERPVETEYSDGGARLGSFRPPAPLLLVPAPVADFAALARTRAGFLVSSYTRMRNADAARTSFAAPVDSDRETYAVESPPPDSIADVAAAAADAADAADTGGTDGTDITDAAHESGNAQGTAFDRLPGGANTGIFLHEMLEKIPVESFVNDLAATRDFNSWRHLQEIRDTFDSGLRRHGIDARHLDEAQRLVHTAFVTPVELGDAGVIQGLCTATRLRREMEFLYPIPEDPHPRLDAAEHLAKAFASDGRSGSSATSGTLFPVSPKFAIRRGYIKGFVDLVFEHRARFYLCDWKSDTLATYAPAAVALHVEHSYSLQARLYALALVKLLRVSSEAEYESRFGGVLYCYLRGMRTDSVSDGVYYRRPSWSEVLGWETELLLRDFADAHSDEPELLAGSGAET